MWSKEDRNLPLPPLHRVPLRPNYLSDKRGTLNKIVNTHINKVKPIRGDNRNEEKIKCKYKYNDDDHGDEDEDNKETEKCEVDEKPLKVDEKSLKVDEKWSGEVDEEAEDEDVEAEESVESHTEETQVAEDEMVETPKETKTDQFFHCSIPCTHQAHLIWLSQPKRHLPLAFSRMQRNLKPYKLPSSPYQHALYQTTNNVYGALPTRSVIMPREFHGKIRNFSKSFRQCGMYKNFGLNTSLNSKVQDWRAFVFTE